MQDRFRALQDPLHPLHDYFRRYKLPGDSYRDTAARTLRALEVEPAAFNVLLPLVEKEVTSVYRENDEPHPSRRHPSQDTAPLIRESSDFGGLTQEQT
jgi:hypothetical protein